MVRSGSRGVLPGLALAAAVLALAGCGSDADPSPPTGIDLLVIPTPSIDASDFVGSVTNRYLQLTRGTQWTYSVTSEVAGGGGPMTVTVEPDPLVVDGVRATVVVSDGADFDATDYYAQDRAGNVWWLGREGAWQAGQAGAEAGLAMPAVVRLGDGWREGYLDGVVEDHAEIINTDDSFKVLNAPYTHVLDLLTSTPLNPGIAHEESYSPGVGLVRSYSVSGLARLVELVRGPTPLQAGTS